MSRLGEVNKVTLDNFSPRRKMKPPRLSGELRGGWWKIPAITDFRASALSLARWA